MKFLDLTIPLGIATPPWPTYEPLQVKYFKRLAPNGANGQPLRVTWTVSNRGIGATNTSDWSDSIWMSRDPAGGGPRVACASDQKPFFAHEDIDRTVDGRAARGELHCGLP